MRLPDDGCLQPKLVAVDWCHEYVLVCESCFELNNLVNSNFSVDIKIFSCFMIINLPSLNKYIHIRG